MGPDIFKAIEQGDADAVRALASTEATARNEDGVSALMLARYYGRHELVDLIREHVAHLDVFEAATVGDAARLRELLDEDAGLARAWSPDGYTPLHYACFFGTAEVARILVEAGAELEVVARGDNEVVPLQSAAAAGNVEAARVLLDAGADPNARAEGRFTPLHSAAQNGDAELARLLLERGADPAARLEDGRTPAELATTDELRSLL